jgi:Rrf2 family protein
MFIYGKTAANAIAVMSYLAADPKRRSGSGEIAEARGISRPLTAKLLTQLASAGLVSGQPGPGGGYTLAKPAESICLLDIVSLFEQTSTNTNCPFGESWCGVGNPCPLHDTIVGMIANNKVFIEKTTLAVFGNTQPATP